MKLLRILCAISFLIAAAPIQSMNMFTQWFKKPYTSQVEYATDELKDLYVKSLKPYIDHLEYPRFKLLPALFGIQKTANKPDRKLALEAEYSQKIKDLVMQGANTNIIESPLHYAIAIDNDDLVRFLLEHGTNPNQADNDGISAFNFAKLHNNPEVVNAFMTTQTIQPINPALVSHTFQGNVKSLLHDIKTMNFPENPQPEEIEKKATIQKITTDPLKQKLP